MKQIISLLNIFFTCALLLTACRGITGNIGYQPPFVPVKVSIDSNGNLSVTLDGSFQTPLGTFSVGVAADPAQFFPNANGTLTVRINGEDTIYDLDGRDVDIKLDSGYYKQVRLRKNGQNWFLEAVKILNNASTSPISVDGYCAYKYGDGAISVMGNRGDAYSWNCYKNDQLVGGVDMSEACSIQYYDRPNAIMGDRSDAYSWYCSP